MGIKHSSLPPPHSLSVPLPPPSKPTDYILEFYWNISKAPEAVRYSLLYQILPIMEDSQSQSDILSQISEYIYSPFALSSTLVLVRHSLSSKIIGFETFFIWEEYLLPHDFSNENKYVLSTGFYILSPLARGKGLLKDIILAPADLKNLRYPLNNCVHFDVSINPLSYWAMSRLAPIFPCFSRKMSPEIEKFLTRMIEKCGYEVVDSKKPFVVKDDTKIDGLDRAEILKNYDKLPGEIKFFVDQTGLQEGLGLAFLSTGLMVKNNTMGLEEQKYDARFKSKLGIIEVDFLRARL